MMMRKHKWLLIIIVCFVLIQSLCLLATSLGASASSSTEDWPMYHRDLKHSGYTIGSSPRRTADLLWNWTVHEAVSSSPAVTKGYVLVGCKDYILYCLNSSNGQLIWYFLTGNEVNSSPAIYSGYVYFGSDDGWFYCLDLATGTPVWESKVGGLLRSCPALADGRIYVGSGDHDLFCLNASDGSTIWNFPTLYRIHSSPAFSDGIVYVATDDYHLYALNASTGEEMWRTHTGSVISSPSISNGYVYIGSIDSYVWGLNASTGAKIWGYQTGGSVSSSPAVAYECVYIGSDDNNVYCLNASNGKKIWQSPTGYWVWSSPAVAYGKVYVGSEDYNIYCLDASTGAVKWSYETGNYVDSSPAIVNGTLYVGSSDHHVYAFTLGDPTSESCSSQFISSLPLTTIAFDVIACTVTIAIISIIARFIHSTWRAKKSAERTNTHTRDSWFSVHADVLFVLAILALSIIFFANLGSGPLWAADEQTYSQWAAHMVKTGDYLQPWAFGDVALWIGKPPLFMWLMSLAYQVFGVNNFASRFWSVVFGVLSLISIFYLGKKLYNSRVGFLSAFVLGTFTTFYLFARHAMTDIPFVFFILASMYFFLLSEKNEGANRYAVLSGLFFGLALMTKQVQALLIPLIIIFYLAVTKRSIRFFFTKRFTLFWGVGLLVVSPWVIYMTIQFGTEFWRVFLIYSNIIRATIPIEGHVEGYFYYFTQLLNSETQLWVILLPFAVGLSIFFSVINRSKSDILILVWMSIVLIVFTIAQTKLYWYILPAFPAFALTVGSLLYQLLRKMHYFTRLLSYKALEVIKIAKLWKQHSTNIELVKALFHKKP